MSVLKELGCGDLISDTVREGATHQAIAAELRQLYPTLPGFSTRSVRRFCSNNEIHQSSNLCTQAIDQVVKQAIAQVRVTNVEAINLDPMCYPLEVSWAGMMACGMWRSTGQLPGTD